MKEHKHNAKIVFWKWLDEETIGFCTLSYAFTWSLNGMIRAVLELSKTDYGSSKLFFCLKHQNISVSGNSEPVRMFKLLESLAPHAIVDYAVNDDKMWQAIVTGPRPNV